MLLVIVIIGCLLLDVTHVGTVGPTQFVVIAVCSAVIGVFFIAVITLRIR